MDWYFIGGLFLLGFYILWRQHRLDQEYKKCQPDCDHEYLKDNNYSYTLYSKDLSTKTLHNKFTCCKCNYIHYAKYEQEK